MLLRYRVQKYNESNKSDDAIRQYFMQYEAGRMFYKLRPIPKGQEPRILELMGADSSLKKIAQDENIDIAFLLKIRKFSLDSQVPSEKMRLILHEQNDFLNTMIPQEKYKLEQYRQVGIVDYENKIA